MSVSRGIKSLRMLLTGGVAVLGTAVAGAGSAAPIAVLHVVPDSVGNVIRATSQQTGPPTTYQCRHGEVVTGVDFSCYQPFQLQDAYNLNPLYAKGIEGQGSTIVIVDAFGSPTIRQDLAVFDRAFGLPAPPSFKIIQPVGTVPPCSADPYGAADCYGWGGETSLDVEWSHAMAPKANILLVETPSSETEGVQGFPDIVAAENYVINHHLGDVISQSFGATEETFLHSPQAYGLRSAFINAAEHGVTVLASSGDDGSTDSYCSPSDRNCTSFPCCYPFRVTSWPTSDPLVTSLGGIQLHLSDGGATLAPATVWNDPNSLFSPGAPGTLGASGGGRSTFFSRPDFQDVVRSMTGDHRSVPDISMSAAVNGGVDTYQSGPGGGWGVYGGTSEASPEFAGIIALADQMAGHSLGDINRALYRMGSMGAPGIVPVTKGDNTFTFCDPNYTKACHLVTVPGFNAFRGYNLATGWGTVDAAKFVPELAAKG